MNKKLLLLLWSFFVCVIPAQAEIDWDYWSPLEVVETISDIGEGDFLYEYSFENVDSSPIWSFAIYTTENMGTMIEPQDSFSGYTNWVGPYYYDIKSVDSVYDARNLDSNIIGIVASSNEQGGGGNPIYSIPVNSTASGFSYICDVYDPNPKYYCYNTIASGPPNYQYGGDGKVAAVGTTIPEPASLIFFLMGSILIKNKYQ